MLVNTELALYFGKGHCVESGNLKFWWEETMEVCVWPYLRGSSRSSPSEVVVFRTENLSLNSLVYLKIIHLVQKINDDRN